MLRPPKLDWSGTPKSKILRSVKPMLATLVSESFDGDDWLFEIKWDGYRAIGSWDGKKAEFYSRNGLDFSSRYSEITDSFRKYLTSQVVLDGEVVALDKNNHSRFDWLQNWGRRRESQLIYCVFDLLWIDGHDLRGWPLIQRREVLKRILPKKSMIRYSDHIVGRGKAFFAKAVQRELEGIMAKKADSPYLEGYRGQLWLKIKTHLRQEAVIGGFTEPRGSRRYIGSLLLGVYQKGDFIFVGHASGMPPSQLKSLHQRLLRLERDSSPFKAEVKANAPAHWVSPKLVCEVNFEEWTAEGLMRQPIFVGLRPDKDPLDIKRELPRTKI